MLLNVLVKIWRAGTTHTHNDHANTRKVDGRVTVADLIGLALRDKLDILSGDWNQAGSYLKECCYHAVQCYEDSNNLPRVTVRWGIPGPVCEIRTIFFNWDINGEKHHMWYKELMHVGDLKVYDFGLKATDGDAHVPQFLMLTKSKEEVQSRNIFHSTSAKAKPTY